MKSGNKERKEEMEEKKQPTRKSSLVLVKPAVRKNSFVSFDDEDTTIGVQDPSDETDITASSNGKKISSEGLEVYLGFLFCTVTDTLIPRKPKWVKAK